MMLTGHKKWGGVTTLALIVAVSTFSQSVDAFATSKPVTIGRKARALGENPAFAPTLTDSYNAFECMNGHQERQSTQINMTPATSGAAALMGITTGGLLGGALHAIAGPDHLAALLPRCCGQRWWRAGRVGALWGTGHGISATILGLLAFGLKNRFSTMPGVSNLLQGASSAMEVAIGASLVVIGLLGMKEAREWKEEMETVVPKTLSAAATEQGVKSNQKGAVIFNGFLHGFSWDGAPSLAPALAVATWRGSISFLLAYGIGTTLAMTIATIFIGESTLRAGEILQRPDIPQKLSMISSILALGVGLFWCFLAMK